MRLQDFDSQTRTNVDPDDDLRRKAQNWESLMELVWVLIILVGALALWFAFLYGLSLLNLPDWLS